MRTENVQIGLCPATAREGDIIAILFGGRVPYFLKSKHDKEFLGLVSAL
jgi:hypothetical protein